MWGTSSPPWLVQIRLILLIGHDFLRIPWLLGVYLEMATTLSPLQISKNLSLLRSNRVNNHFHIFLSSLSTFIQRFLSFLYFSRHFLRSCRKFLLALRLMVATHLIFWSSRRVIHFQFPSPGFVYPSFALWSHMASCSGLETPLRSSLPPRNRCWTWIIEEELQLFHRLHQRLLHSLILDVIRQNSLLCCANSLSFWASQLLGIHQLRFNWRTSHFAWLRLVWFFPDSNEESDSLQS